MHHFVLQPYPISSDRRRHRLPPRRSQTITGGKSRHRQEGKLPHGAVEIDGVPVHEGCGNQAETGGAEALVIKLTVTDLALAMEEHRAAHRIAGLALSGSDSQWARRLIFCARAESTGSDKQAADTGHLPGPDGPDQ